LEASKPTRSISNINTEFALFDLQLFGMARAGYEYPMEQADHPVDDVRDVDMKAIKRQVQPHAYASSRGTAAQELNPER
jgi:hypothetical protein